MSKQQQKDMLTRLDEQIEFFTARRHFSYVGFFEECKKEIEQLRQQIEEAEREKKELPAYLFDGYAVYRALSKKATARTSYDNVSDVLDALVKLWKQPQGGGDGSN